MKWEKKFALNREGDVVFAEYANEKTYRLKFSTDAEAGVFVEKFQSAQAEIEADGKLKSRIEIVGDIGEQTIKLTFADVNRTSSLEMKCSFYSIEEMLSFHSRLSQQILRYSA